MNQILGVLYFTQEDGRLVLDISSAQGTKYILSERRGSGDADQMATMEFIEHGLILRCEAMGNAIGNQKIRCILEYDDGNVPDAFKPFVYYGIDKSNGDIDHND